METTATKSWGQLPFWGVGAQFDPDWFLTKEQKRLQQEVIELCRKKIRPNAVHCDKNYTYPRASLDALAGMGLLSLLVPKELGGRGENHVGAAMVVETIARYGCPSTAMVYVMHLYGTSLLLIRHHSNPFIRDLLRNLDKKKLVGTTATSDPSTGGHFWFPLTSKCKFLPEDQLRLVKYGAWATSAGFADWYGVHATSPSYEGDPHDLSLYLLLKDEVRAFADEWEALGMHGNQSGPVICEGTLNKERLIGKVGEGRVIGQECEAYFTLLLSSCYNGISMGSIDLAKRHVTTKGFGDVGMRICDYPSIQDYFGDCISSTNCTRLALFSVTRMLDEKTKNDWSLHKDPKHLPRSDHSSWFYQMKLQCTINTNEVVDIMLHACGGTGYKTELGLERLLRDGKAGWVMAPSNEISRQIIGKLCLLGFEEFDLSEKQASRPSIDRELKKMTVQEKEELIKELQEDVDVSKRQVRRREEDFDNPFNTKPPIYVEKYTLSTNGTEQVAGLHPDQYTSLKLVSKEDLAYKTAIFTFALQKPTNHLGCVPGQYIQVRISGPNNVVQERFFSPVSRPDQLGTLQVITKYESQGLLSQKLQQIQPGDEMEFRGPCGGFEYFPNTLEHLILIGSGVGVTPALQLLRCVQSNPKDKTRVTLFYAVDSEEDILCRQELDSYNKSDERIKVVYILREPPEDWEGEEGLLERKKFEKFLKVPNGSKEKVIMCAGPSVVISCLQSLRWMSFPSDCIFIYGQFGTEFIRTVFGRNALLSSHRSDA